MALLLRLHVFLLNGGITAIGGYDEGVHYSAADALIHGRLTYRDLLFLQPPGIVVLTSPFAFIGSLTQDSLGLNLARFCVMALGVANSVMICRLLQRRNSLAGFVGGLVYACFVPAVYSETAVLLEPIGSATTVAAIALLSSRNPTGAKWGAVAGGVLLGVGITIKILYVVPLVVLVAFYPGRRARVLTAAAVTAFIICVGFFAADPSAMFREVVLDQTGRPRNDSLGLVGRLQGLLGLRGPWGYSLQVPVELAALCGVAVILAIGVALLERRHRVFAVLLLAEAAVLLASPPFYAHYAVFTAVPLALTSGAAAGYVAQWHKAAAAGLGIAVVSTLATTTALQVFTVTQHPYPAAAMSASLSQVQGCVTTNDPTVLILSNRLSSQLSAGCPFRADISGYALDSAAMSAGKQTTPLATRWLRSTTAYLESGEANLLSYPALAILKNEPTIRDAPIRSQFGIFALRDRRDAVK